jgi:hypothetical protein
MVGYKNHKENYSKYEKAIKEYLNGNLTQSQIEEKYNLEHQPFIYYLRQYKIHKVQTGGNDENLKKVCSNVNEETQQKNSANHKNPFEIFNKHIPINNQKKPQRLGKGVLNNGLDVEIGKYTNK